MVLFNYSTRELTAKIVYYGPGLCGKTTNLQYIYDSLPDNVKKGKMLSLATKTDRTLFFDFLPIELGMIRGMKTRVQLYTVPGQVFYNSTRKLVLKAADGVVFVADSQSKMLEANGESYKNLEDNLREMGIHIEEIPLVMQFNKRDLPNLASIEEMNTQINRHNAPFYESVATTGIGVEDTLKAITKLVLNNLAAKYRLEGAPAAEAPTPARPAPARPATAQRAAASAPKQPFAPAEDLALDALEIEDEAPVVAPPRKAARPAVPVSARVEEIFELGDAIDLAEEGGGESDAIDLGEELLQELDEEPVAVAAPHVPERRGGGARPPAPPLRAVPARVVSDPDDALDLDEPIELGDGWEPQEAGSSPAPETLDLGVVAPGEERTLELPVSVRVDGRAVRLKLRVTIRLNR